MDFQIAGAVIIPVIILIVTAPVYDKPIKDELAYPVLEKPAESVYVAFFILWVIWLLLLTRILIQVGRGRFRITRAF